MNKLSLFGILIIFSSLLFANDSKLYKWTDADGKVHYSQIRPKNVPSEQMHVKRAGTLPEKSSSKQEKSYGWKKQANDEEQGDDFDLSDDMADEERCRLAKKNMATLKAHARIRVNDAQGKNRVLSPEEQDAMKARTEKEIGLYCS